MGSKSNSNQSTVYNTTTSYEYNQLDGGAIEEAFDFANKSSQNAFDSVDNSVNKGFGFGEYALDFAEVVAEEAFDVVGETYNTALAAQNAQLGQMGGLVKSTQTQGATELISANQKSMQAMFAALAAIFIVLILVMAFSGKKK